MIYAFGQFELDTRLYELRQEGALVALEPQVFDVLSLLLENRDRVVGKEELLERIWSDRFISESTLTSRLTVARQAVGDSARKQNLIKTIHGRGYRFVGDVAVGDVVAGEAPVASSVAKQQASPSATETGQARGAASARESSGSAGPRVTEPVRALGRQQELENLHRALASALDGARQVVFITGEAGVGKTTLLEDFLEQAQAGQALWVGAGQCLEHSGAGEAYMPVLEAVGRLCRAGGEQIINLLARRAPTWMAQMPWLLSDQELEALQRRIGGNTSQRMLREMGEALESLAAERPVLLVLEDLHWSDPSTVDLIAWIAARNEPCRLLLIATYRPEDVAKSGHSLAAIHQRLRLRAQCTDAALPFLSQDAIHEYLVSRHGLAALADSLAPLVFRRTDGNALFVVNLVQAWIGEGLLAEKQGAWVLDGELDELESKVPETLRHLIAQGLTELAPELEQILAAASVAGMSFSAAIVAAGLDQPEDEVEDLCARLATQGRFLRDRGTMEWPDGTITSQFGFIHSLGQEVVYSQVRVARKARLHQRIGARLEAAYAQRTGDHAAELAMHFLRGRDFRRAVHYLQSAAQQALSRCAHREAVDHLRRGQEVLAQLEEGEERSKMELSLQATLAPALVLIEGWSSPRVEQAFFRARSLSEQLGDQGRHFFALYGLATMFEIRGEFERCYLTLDRGERKSAWPALEYHEMMACSTFHQGWHAQALEHAGASLAGYQPGQPILLAAEWGESAAVRAYFWVSFALWFRGFPDQAVAKLRQGVEVAEESAHLLSLSGVRGVMACLHQLRQETEPALQWARDAIAIAETHGFSYRAAVGVIVEGWALGMQGDAETGIAKIRQGLTCCRENGAELDRPYFIALLIEVCLANDLVEKGLEAVKDALDSIASTRRYFYEAELHRLKGCLLLAAGPSRDEKAAAESLEQSLSVARDQEAKSLELRTATNLGRLWQGQGRQEEARALLTGIVGWFEAGLDSSDLAAARELLAELG